MSGVPRAPMRPLETARLELQPLSAGHADEMFAVLSDPAIYQYENAPPPSLPWLRARYERLESRGSPDGRQHWLNWVVRLRGEGLVGYVQATVHADGRAAIAYEFGSAWWGRGLAGEAVQAMLDELARQWQVRRLTAVLKRDNQRSLRLLRRLGFAPATQDARAACEVEPDELLMLRPMGLARSPVERFLTDFHDARPGGTPQAFAALPVQAGGRRYASSYDRLLATVPETDQACTVLDLACGDGYLLSLLAARRQPGLSLMGVDLSEGELRVARRRLGPAAALHQARAQSLPLPDGSVDQALCHMALMLMDDVDQVLAELARVLRPGGQLAAVVGAGALPSPAFDVYVALLRQHRRQPRYQDVRFGDPRLRDAAGIATLLAPRFDEVQVEELAIQRRLTPLALWAWFLEMYDLSLLDEADQRAIGTQFLAQVAPLCGPDGKLQHDQHLRFFAGRRRTAAQN